MSQNATPMIDFEAALLPNEGNVASSGRKGRSNLKLLQARQDNPIRGFPETPIVVFGLLASSVGPLAGRPNIQICPYQNGLICKYPPARAAKLPNAWCLLLPCGAMYRPWGRCERRALASGRALSAVTALSHQPVQSAGPRSFESWRASGEGWYPPRELRRTCRVPACT